MKNLFIVIDGMDGSGKGEMVNRLHNYLFNKSKDIIILTTREPTAGKDGNKAREILKEEKDPKESAEKLLKIYVDDRKSHLETEIEPFLNVDDGKKRIVICDRYYYSTIAFQHTQGLSMDRVLEANKSFRKPDIAFILDLPVNIALSRIDKARQEREKFEDKNFMQDLRNNFLSLKDFIEDNLSYIDASKDIDVVFDQIKEEINKIL